MPRRAGPSRSLGDDERREINAASGLRLRLHEDALNVERLFFYAACRGRPSSGWPGTRRPTTARPVRSLSSTTWPTSAPGWAQHPGRRELGRRLAAGDAAPTEREAARFAAAAAPPAHRRISRPACARGARPLRDATPGRPRSWRSGRRAPVRWFVERHLRPEVARPRPRADGARRTRPPRLGDRAVRAADGGGLVPDAARGPPLSTRRLEERGGGFRTGRTPSGCAGLRRLDVPLRYLEFAAHAGSGCRHALFKVKFGQAEDPHLALELDDAAPDAGRIDASTSSADGREGSSTTTRARRPPGRPSGWRRASSRSRCTCWRVRQRARAGAGGRPLQPLGAGRAAARRGAARRRPRPGDVRQRPRRRRRAGGAAGRLRGGGADRGPASCAPARWSPRRTRCAYVGGCAFPTICRCVTA